MMGKLLQEYFLERNFKKIYKSNFWLISNDLKESIVIGQYVCNKVGGTSLYPNDPEKKAKIEEILEEISSGFDTLFIPLTRVFGVPEKTGANEKYVSSMKKLAETRLTKV